MKKKIAVLKGDGIGPEVVDQALKVLYSIEEKFNHEFEFTEALIGAASIDEHGIPLTDGTINICRESDAVLLGAVGDPKYDNSPDLTVRPEQGLLKLRKSLHLHTNVRPTTIYPSLRKLSPLKENALDGVDFEIYRELSSGIYFGDKGFANDEKTTAFDVCEYSVDEIKIVARIAFEAAMRREKKLTLIDKANVLETSRLWRKCIQELATEYPEVEVSYLFVDNAAMQMILNPAQFDVIVTSNMFGDIISDEASVISGSIGLAPSSSIGKKLALFEPIHGSYPQAANQDKANPVATILSVAMMMDYFEMPDEAKAIRNAVAFCVESEVGTTDVFPLSVYKCSDVGDIIAELIVDNELKERLQSATVQTII